MTCWLFLPRGGHSPSDEGTGLRAESVCDKGWPRPQPWTEGGVKGASRGVGWGDPQPDLRCAQQVGLHRRARVSHSSMASGWRVKGSWGEEDRPSHLREGPPLTSWAQAWWGRGLTWPAESVFWYLDVRHWAFYTLLGHVGPPPGGRSQGVSREQEGAGGGVFWGNPQSHPVGRLPDMLCLLFWPRSLHKYTETMTGILL